jgi:hypothetical protein
VLSGAGVCDVDAVDVWGLGCPAPYIMACIYAVICMLLLNVQVRQAAAVLAAAHVQCIVCIRSAAASCAAACSSTYRCSRQRGVDSSICNLYAMVATAASSVRR